MFIKIKYLTRDRPVMMRHFIVLRMYVLMKLSRAPACSSAVCLRQAQDQPLQPLETEVAVFADIAPLSDIAQRLDLVQLLTCCWPPSTAPFHPPVSCNSPTGTAKPP